MFRWHMLSWVMDWNELKTKCLKLLENPSIRLPTEELKYLNIDYTQFDEWSSDDEITMYTGIEKGYEKWLEVDNDEDDKFSEHGLTSDDEEVVFNTKHTIDRLDYDDYDHFVTDSEYRMAKLGGKPIAMDVEDEITADEPIENDDKNVFTKVNDNIEPEPEKRGAKNEKPTESMDVNFAFVKPYAIAVDQLHTRLTLSHLVPGLEESNVPPTATPSSTQVMMVQIKVGGSQGGTPGSPAVAVEVRWF